MAEDQNEVGENVNSVSWQAPEFIDHDKTVGWFIALAVAAIIFAAIIYLITKDKVSSAVIIVVAIIFGAMAIRKPRLLNYTLDPTGININQRIYDYDSFKSFSIQPEGHLLSITFAPLKRFAPYLTIYYPPESEEKIMTVLAQRLPYQEPKRDAVDSLMRRIKF